MFGPVKTNAAGAKVLTAEDARSKIDMRSV